MCTLDSWGTYRYLPCCIYRVSPRFTAFRCQSCRDSFGDRIFLLSTGYIATRHQLRKDLVNEYFHSIHSDLSCFVQFTSTILFLIDLTYDFDCLTNWQFYATQSYIKLEHTCTSVKSQRLAPGFIIAIWILGNGF